MKKSLSIFAALIIVLMGLTSACSSYKNQKVNLYTGMQPIKSEITVVNYSSDFVELRIRIDQNTDLQTRWLYHIIEDEQKNFISEGWYPTTIGHNTAYTIKIKAKEGYSFESGREYSLCIGLRNPEETVRVSNNYMCKIYQKFVI